MQNDNCEVRYALDKNSVADVDCVSAIGGQRSALRKKYLRLPVGRKRNNGQTFSRQSTVVCVRAVKEQLTGNLKRKYNYTREMNSKCCLLASLLALALSCPIAKNRIKYVHSIVSLSKKDSKLTSRVPGVV